MKCSVLGSQIGQVVHRHHANVVLLTAFCASATIRFEAWLGIFLLVGWEFYLNSPLFDRAAPMAPVLYEILM